MYSLNVQVYKACRYGHRDRAKSLLLNNKISRDFTRVPRRSIDTSLHQACRKGWLDIVDLLIKKCGFSPDITDENGESPLHYACKYGRFDIVKYLIKQGSNPRMKDKLGREPLDYAFQYNQIVIACYLCQNCISSAEILLPDRKKRNLTIVRKILQHDLCSQLFQLKTTDGDSFLNLVFYSSNMITSCMSSKRFTQKLKRVPYTKNIDTIPHLLVTLCHYQSNVSCVPSAVMSDWLNDTRLDIKELVVSCNWKTADGDTLLQIICRSKSCVSRISSVRMKDWLIHTNTDIIINNLNCVTFDKSTLLTVLNQIDSKSFQHKSLFSHDTPIIEAIVTPHWETDDGHSSLKVLFRSELYISCRSSTCLMKWLSKTSIELNRIVTVDMKTTDDRKVLELLFKSESCISRISSEVMLRWLTIVNKTFNPETLIVPNWKTADGDSLLQIVCKSKPCVSCISSVTMRDWLTNTNTDLLVDKLDYVTSDNITLLMIVDKIDSKSFEYKNSFTPVEVIITPHWETVDGHSSLKVLFRSQLYISCGSSTCLTKWLSKTSLDLNRIVPVDLKTTDDKKVLELLFKSESCISHVSSTVILRWLTDTTLTTEELIVMYKWLTNTTLDLTTLIIPNIETADGDTLLELICMSEEIISHIPSTVMLKWLTDSTIDLSKSLITPNWKTGNGDTLLQIVCQSRLCVSRISSKTMKDWLKNTNTDLLIDNLYCETADRIHLLTLIHQIKSRSFNRVKILSRNKPIDAIITPHWETVDGHTSLKVLFRSELYISCGSSTCLTKWLSKTSLDLNRIVAVDMKTTDDKRVLELVFKSESCVSQISSKVILKWLTDTTLSIEELIVPNWKTADGDTLLQLVCNSELCLSHISSYVIMKWLKNSVLDLTSLVPNLKTADGQTLFNLVCCSKFWLSRISSSVILNWLHEQSKSGLNGSVLSSCKTADGDTMFKLLCTSEHTFSHSSSSLMLKWINEGNESTIDTLKTVSPNWMTFDGDAIYHLLCQANIKELKIIGLLGYYLQQRSLNPNVTNSEGNTAAHFACKFGKHTVVTFLLTKAHCDINIKNNSELFPLDMTMDPEIICCLCEYDCSSLSSKTVEGWLNNSALIDEQNLLRIFKLLVNRGAIDRSTLFHFVCSRVHDISRDSLSLVRSLLSEIHCDPNCLDSNKQMLIQVTSDLKIMKILVQYGAKVTSDVVFKVIANASEQPSVTDLLLTSSTNKTLVWNLNDTNEDGETALQLAFKLDKPMIVTFLVMLGAKVTADIVFKVIANATEQSFVPDLLIRSSKKKTLVLNPNDGETAIQFACNVNKLEFVWFLVEHGVKVTSDVVFKVIANASEHSSVTEMLLLSSSKKTLVWNPDDTNEDGDTALHLACKVDKPVIVRFLVTEGRCNPNYKNIENKVPLELTINLDCVTILIEHGATLTPEILLKYIAEESIPKHLLPEVIHNPDYTDSDGNTALHLACKADQQSIVNFLLSQAHCDPNINNNKDEVPLQMTTNPDIIKNLIKYGAQTSMMYESHKSALGTNKPIQPPVKVFVVGNPSVGKSTLTAALKMELKKIKKLLKFKKVSDIKKKTAGIVPHEFDSIHFGRVTLYDFAGHREFYSGHAALLQVAVQSTPPIFLLVVNLCDEDNKILQDILYWISFLENQCALVSCKPHIIIVGSHEDTLRSIGANPVEKISTLSKLLHADYFINLYFNGFIAMNCQEHKSDAINDLRQILDKSCKHLRIQEPITFNAHCFLVYLIDAFTQEPAVTIGKIHDHIEQQQLSEERGVLEFLPISFEALYRICVELNDRGHILFLKDKMNIQNSYVVIDKEFLLSKVSGTVFASDHFKEHKHLATNTGVVSQSKLSQCFPNIDIKILLGFLSHLEFCHEISDQGLHQLITECYSPGFEERYYLFPDLISVEVNKSVWETKSPFKFHFGWIVQCTKSEQFFSSRFLQVLLLRLAFSCALKSFDEDQRLSIHRKCSLWKNGIYWGKNFGMDMLVEISADKSVIILARFNESNVVKCIKQRSQVIRTVLDCIEQFCPRLSVAELLIDSSLALSYPFSLTSEASAQIQCTVKDLAEALVSNCESPSVVLSENGNCVPVESFISFEPYSEIEAATLMELWDENNADKVIPDLYLSRFVRKLSRNLAWLVKIFNESANTPISKDNLLQEIIKWRNDAEPTPMTYKQLHQKLDEHSIFASRNVLVSIINYYNIPS